MKFPEVDDIIELNKSHIIQTGGFHNGLDNVRNENSLKWVVEVIRNPFSFFDPYHSLVEKAAILSYTIIHTHIFFDGNKRTGMSALKIFLLMNGYKLEANDDVVISIALSIAGEVLPIISFEEYVTWIRSKISVYSPQE